MPTGSLRAEARGEETDLHTHSLNTTTTGMAHTAVASTSSDDGEDIGARLRKLNLPQRPLIMDKVNRPRQRHCGHSDSEKCWCYEYTTMLPRPEYEGKWLPDSPEPVETPVKVLTNGNSRGRDGREDRDRERDRDRDRDREERDAGGSGGAGTGTGTVTVTGTVRVNGTNKLPEKKKFSLGQYKDRKLAGKTPAKTNPSLPPPPPPPLTSHPPAGVAAAALGATSKNSPMRTGDKKSVFFTYLHAFYQHPCTTRVWRKLHNC